MSPSKDITKWFINHIHGILRVFNLVFIPNFIGDMTYRLEQFNKWTEQSVLTVNWHNFKYTIQPSVRAGLHKWLLLRWIFLFLVVYFAHKNQLARNWNWAKCDYLTKDLADSFFNKRKTFISFNIFRKIKQNSGRHYNNTNWMTIFLLLLFCSHLEMF